MIRMKRIIPAAFFISAIAFQIFGFDLEDYNAETPEEMITAVAELYDEGEYEKCRDLLDQLIIDYESDILEINKKKFAAVYYQKALISYAFREEGYEEEIEQLILNAVKLNINIEIEKPASTPPFILERFMSIKKEYLDQFSHTSRRHSLGIFGAFVLEPTLFTDPNIVQPGIHYSFNLNEGISLGLDFRFPLTDPFWNSLRGQAGATFYPTYSVETFYTGYSVYYLFALDELSRYKHSISFSAQLEYIFRNGIGFAFSAEILRLDLFWDAEGEGSLPSYGSLTLISDLLTLSFANMSFFIYYTF